MKQTREKTPYVSHSLKGYRSNNSTWWLWRICRTRGKVSLKKVFHGCITTSRKNIG